MTAVVVVKRASRADGALVQLTSGGWWDLDRAVAARRFIVRTRLRMGEAKAADQTGVRPQRGRGQTPAQTGVRPQPRKPGSDPIEPGSDPKSGSDPLL